MGRGRGARGGWGMGVLVVWVGHEGAEVGLGRGGACGEGAVLVRVGPGGEELLMGGVREGGANKGWG